MDMLTFAVSCLTGFGALALIAIAGVGGFICFVMWQDKQEQPKTEPLDGFYQGCHRSLLAEFEKEQSR